MPLNSAQLIATGQLDGFRNRIINGGMVIDQRNAVVTTTLTYVTDRWALGVSTTGAVQSAKSNDFPPSFSASLLLDVTTADTSIGAGEYAVLSQRIEGLNVADLGWGTASAKTVTLSFWVKSTTTGTYCVGLRNSDGSRSYVAEYTVSSANTWEKKAITIPGATAGTWNVTNGLGVDVVFTFACGTTYQTTPNTWAAGNFFATSNQVNLLASTANEARITGVQFELGTVATEFEVRSYGQELALCQRYYYKTAPISSQRIGVGFVISSVSATGQIPFPVTMRVAPTELIQSGVAGNYGVAYTSTNQTCSSVPVFYTADTAGAQVVFTVASGLTAGQGCSPYPVNGSGFLAWSAEL